MLVRDRFRGQSFVNALVDLPFALPTIVAGLTLLALYGPNGPFGVERGVHAGRDRARAPVRDAAVRDAHGAAGAARARPRDGGGRRVARRRSDPRSSGGSCFPNLFPAILSGVALAFARAIGEFGSVVLISGNLPFKTEVASVYIFGRIESGRPARRCGGVGRAARRLVRRSCSLIGGLRRRVTRHDRVGTRSASPRSAT